MRKSLRNFVILFFVSLLVFSSSCKKLNQLLGIDDDENASATDSLYNGSNSPSVLMPGDSSDVQELTAEQIIERTPLNLTSSQAHLYDSSVTFSWETPPEPSKLTGYRLDFYSGNNESCTGTPDHTADVPSSQTTFSYNLFDHSPYGLVRYTIVALYDDGTEVASSCSGEDFVRTGSATYPVSTNIGTVSPATHWYENTAFGDFNGDSIMDIAMMDTTANSNNGLVTLLISSKASISDRTIHTINGAAGFQIRSIEAGDLNADGRDELLMGRSIPITTDMYAIIEGSSSFPTSLNVLTEAKIYSLDGQALGTADLTSSAPLIHRNIFDLNGDGYLDLVVNEDEFVSGGRLHVISGDGPLPASGNLNSVSTATYSNGASLEKMGVTGSYAIDMNGDGIKEMFMSDFTADGPGSSRGCNSIYIGASSFPASNTISNVGRQYCSHANFTSMLGYIAGNSDFNGDGLVDHIAYSGIFAPYYVSVYLGTAILPASAVTTTSADRTYTISFTGANSINYADVNGDGATDILVGGTGELSGRGELHIILGSSTSMAASGAATSAAVRVYEGVNTSDAFGYCGPGGDFNGDGFSDLLCSSTTKFFIVFGGSTLPASGSISNASVGRSYELDGGGTTHPTFPLMADLNGDGRDDIVTFSSTGAGYIGIIEGASTPPASGDISTAGKRYNGLHASHALASDSLEIRDFNGDGMQDIIIYQKQSGTNASLTEPGELCIILGRASFPASGSITDVAQCFSGTVDNEYLRPGKSGRGTGDLGLSMEQLTGDNLDELVLQSNSGGDLRVLVFTNNSTEIEMVRIASSEWGDGHSGILANEFIDLDGDGIKDFVTPVMDQDFNGSPLTTGIQILSGASIFSSDL